MVTRNQLIALGLFVLLGAAVLWFGRVDTSRTDSPELKRKLFVPGSLPDEPSPDSANTAPGSTAPNGAPATPGAVPDNSSNASSSAKTGMPQPDANAAAPSGLNAATDTTAPPSFEFPASPSRELFLSKCALCHSLKYITMQNDFSREFWQDEVSKMIKVHHANISEPEANEIVQYLSTIKR